MEGFITMLLTVVVEAMKLSGDHEGARKVGDVLKGRPKLSESETEAWKRAAERLGHRP